MTQLEKKTEKITQLEKQTVGKKKLHWYNLAMMSFVMVWGFGNVINGFATFGGVRAVVPWLFVFILYMIPYSLIVAELGSVFDNESGGVSSWVLETIGPLAAFYAGWTYWVVQLPYISQKPNSIIIAASWIIFHDARISSMNVTFVQLLGLAIFAVAMLLAIRGVSFLKKIGTIAGTAMFVMSLLFILMVWTAPAITGANLLSIDWSFKAFAPELNFAFFTNLSILIFAVVGVEEVAPYVKQMENPKKDFPKGMIILVMMVCVCALLGTIAMGMMFDSNHLPDGLLTNGAYFAFQKLGAYYHMGNTLMIIYAICAAVSYLAVIIISIDAPLRILMDGTTSQYIPKPMFKKNKYGVYTNGLILISVIVTILILLPAFGIDAMNELVYWLIKLNAICTPIINLWIFAAYFMLKKHWNRFDAHDGYVMTKNRAWGMTVSGWCFLVTAVCCIMGMYSASPFELVMNIATPVILVVLGMIMPWLARRYNEKHGLDVPELPGK